MRYNNNIEDVFTKIYDNFVWHMGSGESRSGIGSSLNYSNSFKNELINILEKYEIDSVLDCSCGDWNWMKNISESFRNYTGLDCVASIIDTNNEKYSTEDIRFIHSDMLSYLKKTPDKYFDLTIIRHTLEHLPFSYSLPVLIETKRCSRYSIITSYSEAIENVDLDFPKNTYRPISLLKTPYIETLGLPLYVFYDGPENPKLSEKHAMGFLYEHN